MSAVQIRLREYSTGFGVSGGSALILEFYPREVANPVHLTVDTGLKNGEASIKAYMSTNLSLGERQLAAQFNEIPLDLRMVEAERVGFDVFKKTIVDKLPNDLEGMETTMERLLILIDDIHKYVDDVVISLFPFLSRLSYLARACALLFEEDGIVSMFIASLPSGCLILPLLKKVMGPV